MMQMSETINELSAALAKAQGEINNPTKGSVNPHLKSRYADLAEVLSVVRPAFSANGLAVSQHPSVEGALVTVESLLTHSSGQWLLSSVSAPANKADAQGIGSSITYCRRYALAAIAGVAQEDDDGHSSKPQARQEQKQQTQKPAQHEASTPGLAPWTKKDVASIILGSKTVAEMDKFMAENSTQIAIDLTNDENKSFLAWFDGQRAAMVEKEGASK